MERRMLMAVVLSFLAVTLYMTTFGRGQPKPPPDGEPGTENPAEPGPAPGPGDPAPGPGDPAPGPTDPVPSPSDPAPVPVPAPVLNEGVAFERHVVRTPELEVAFVNAGAAIESITLLTAFEPDKTTPLDLVVPVAPDLLLGQVDDSLLKPRDGAPGGANRRDDPAGWMRTIRWQRNEAAEAQTPELLDVVYEVTLESGGIWRKQWVLADEAKRYDVALRLSYRPPAGQTAAPIPVKVLVASGLLREPSTGAAFQEPNVSLLRLARQDEAEELPHGVPLPDTDIDPNDLRLLGTRSHYFLSTYFLGGDKATNPRVLRWWGTGESAERRPHMKENVETFYREQRGRDAETERLLRDRIEAGIAQLQHDWVVVEVPTEVDQAIEIPLYVGPISRDVLSQDAYAMVKPVIRYRAAPDILAAALLGIYDFFRSLFGNAGVAVILMTIVVRSLMMPLSIKNQLSMRQYSRKIAKLKPKLETLKQKFGGNVKKMREEQAKLYREHGVGFPTGCLMLFVQLPIFFALFSSLRAEYTLRNEAFLWIKDLSGPDKLIDFGGMEIDLIVLTIFSINILPLLMVGLSIWQQRLMPKPADEQQAQQMRMMKWLPIVFAVILYNYTAALALYMVLSSTQAIIESRIVRWKDKDGGGEGGGAWVGAPGL